MVMPNNERLGVVSMPCVMALCRPAKRHGSRTTATTAGRVGIVIGMPVDRPIPTT